MYVRQPAGISATIVCFTIALPISPDHWKSSQERDTFSTAALTRPSLSNLPVWLYQTQKCVGLSQMLIPPPTTHTSQRSSSIPCLTGNTTTGCRPVNFDPRFIQKESYGCFLAVACVGVKTAIFRWKTQLRRHGLCSPAAPHRNNWKQACVM